VDSTGSSHHPYQLFVDLADAVRQRVPLPAHTPVEEIGFFDRSAIEVGDQWRQELLNALLDSRVLVALQSLGYLKSETCGKELEVFRQRRERYMAAPRDGVNAPPVALPITWETPALMRDLPEVLEAIQYDNEKLGDAYAEHGLRKLANLTRWSDDYKEFVDTFAQRIVEAARPNALPRVELGDVEQVPSAFRSRRTEPAARETADDGPDRGEAWFVFFVGTRDEVGGVRKDVTAYAADAGAKWQPFHPSVTKPVRILALNAAHAEELWPQTLEVDDKLLEHLRRAEERQSFVLLIVDPWSARLERYQRYLAKFDENKMINAEILVPTSADDPETAGEHDALLADVRRTFYRTFALNSSSLRDSIASPDAFQQEVIAAINEIRKRLMQVGDHRPVRGSGTAGSLPQLSGPGGG
jgi:FxsC-like protein